MNRSPSILALAALLALTACGTSDATESPSGSTVTVTTVDAVPTIVRDETTVAPETVDGPAMDSIEEGMPTARQPAGKK